MSVMSLSHFSMCNLQSKKIKCPSRKIYHLLCFEQYFWFSQPDIITLEIWCALVYKMAGHYSTEKLLEMIALHLDATYADRNIWKEFASCFLKLSPSEEDRISTCNDKTLQGQSKNFNRKPVIVANSVMGKEWKLRCRWWMTRHFSKMILVSEFEAGIFNMLYFSITSLPIKCSFTWLAWSGLAILYEYIFESFQDPSTR